MIGLLIKLLLLPFWLLWELLELTGREIVRASRRYRRQQRMRVGGTADACRDSVFGRRYFLAGRRGLAQS